MRSVASLEEHSRWRGYVALSVLIILFSSILVSEQRALNAPWWTYIKDFTLMIVAFATAFKQSRSNSAVVIFDGCDPEGEPSELSAGRYLYRLEIDKPKETRISIADADVHIESLDSPSDADRPLSDTESIAKTLLATEGDVRHAIDITDEALNILIWLSDSKTGVFRVTGIASIDLTIRFRPTDRRERALEVRFPFTNMISGKRGCDE